MAFFAFASSQRHRAVRWGVLAALCASLIAVAIAGGATVAQRETPVSTSISPPSGNVFARAQARGTLIVGIPYLEPERVAGAKIRTEERLDTVMAQRLGQQLGLPVNVVQIDAAQHASALAQGDVDVLIADRKVGDAKANQIGGTVAVPTGYAARPKAIIRSDTTLRNWHDVKKMTVCMSSAAFQAQALAESQGATVRTYRVPSDALVAVREGSCDIGLVDDMLWKPLMNFPEWRNFSSTLNEVGPQIERVWVIADNASTQAWLTTAMKQWRSEGAISAMTNQWARDLAFDVYLDQEVPDCHGG